MPIRLIKLLERHIIATIDKNIPIQLKIDRSSHAHDRQTERDISDDEIKSIADKFLPKITRLLISNKINLNDTLVLKHHHLDKSIPDVNLVCAIQQSGVTGDSSLYLAVITAIRKNNFVPNNPKDIVIHS